MMDDKYTLKVNGMTCTGCATTIKNALEKEGATNVFVDFSMGEASFSKSNNIPLEKLIRAIEKSGYIVKEEEEDAHQQIHLHHKKIRWLFFINACLTTPLLLHMLIDIPILNKFSTQLILSTPVIIIGLYHFGKSALQSIIHKSPNMDVLILTGALASYIYSIVGWMIYHSHHYMFFETSASIITFIMLGNFIEEYSVAKTTEEIKKLQKSNEIKYATKKTEIEGKIFYEQTLLENISIGDIILIKEGEQVPLDCKIIMGEVNVNESIITGESHSILKKNNDELIAGSIIVNGNAEAYVIRKKSETLLSQIIEIVKKSQRNKTNIQKLGDKISAIFVPAIIIIAIFTFIINYFLLHDVSESMLRAIAVLVISCPCAMGLAAPTAIAVILGIAAKNRILIKNTSALEILNNADIFVLDKTGTITTGNIQVEKFQIFSDNFPENKILSLIYSAESRSIHPIAKALTKFCSQKKITGTLLIDYKEQKGLGLKFKEFNDPNNIEYQLGSYHILEHHQELKKEYDVFFTANNQIIAAFKLSDELQKNVNIAIQELIKQNKKVFLLSGDKKENCIQTAQKTGIPINNVFFEQSPTQKLNIIEKLKKEGTVCMLGDGINDAPAMATANVSISFNTSSSIALDSATIIISHQDVFDKFLMTLKISKIAISKIKQNYFWAFLYNAIAIPIAAMGFLMPIIASLSMTFSDVIVVGNSLSIYRYKWEKI